MSRAKGHRFRTDECPDCCRPPLYYSSVDTFGCPDCDIWTEEKCHCRDDGHECPFDERPAKPSLYIGKVEDVYGRRPK